MPNLPKITVKDIKTYLDGILKTSSSSTYDRKLSSLKKFFTWAQKQGYFQENAVEDYLNQKESQIISKVVKAEKENSQTTKPGLPFYSSVQARLISKFEGKSRIQNFLYKAFYSRPEWYKTYHSVLFTRYFHFAILTIFSVGLVLGTYDQFRQKATPASAFPTSLVRPKRYLSFQGRLTNQYGNPVTGATNIIFKLWDHSTNSTEVACDGGVDENCLWSTSTCSVDPDADGIFNVLLGTTSGADFTCSTATEITSDVFSENAEVWLGVKVDTDAEATPRIQIATVAYALNAETLQGYPIDATGSATKNSVVTMNDGGEIIIAESGPTMKSVSGTFSIQGKALSISTPDTSNGSVTINPDGTGTLDLTFEGAAAGGGAGGFVNAINASITSGALYFGQVASAATGYDFIQFKSGSSPTEKFAIDDAGNITTAGDMAVNGGDITSSGALNLTPGGALTVGATGQNLTLQGAITALTSTGAGNDITLTSIDDIVFNDAQLSSAINLTDTDTVFSSGDTAIVDAINTAYGAAIGGVGSVWTLDTGKVYPTTISNNVGIGTTTAANIISKLFLTNDSTLTGKALAIFNQTESQDILTASASGTTVANLDISGNLAIEGSISDLSGTVLTIDDDLKVTGNDIQDSGGNVIISSDGSGKIDSLANIATTLTMDVANEINFRDAALKIYSSADGQLDIDADTLVQITSPTTQIVSSTALDLDSPLLNLATQATDIELKDDTGSALTISEGSNNYFLVTTTDDNEIVTLDLPAGGGTSLTGNLFISNIAKTINLGTGTAIDTINIGTETTSADIVNIGSVNAGNVTLVTAAILDVDAATVNIDGSTAINIGTTADKPIDIDATTFDLDASGALTLTGASNSVIDFPNFDVATTGNITTAGDLAVNGGDITSTATTFNFDIGDTGTLNFRDGTNTLVAISDQGTTGRLAVSDSLQVGSTSTLAYSRFGTATTGHAGNLTAADDLLISSDMELDGILYLDGGNIANSAGNSTIVFTGSPTTGQNALSASSWLIENTTNVGLAALTVNQTKAGDIFTASASGTPKFVITNAGNVGIGTTAPGAKLDVRGSAIFNEDGTDSDFRIEGNEDYNLFFVDASADKIGIGIGATAPDALLTVGRSLPGAYIGKFQNSDTSGDVLKLIGAGTSNSRFILNLQNSAGAGTAMVVTQAGNVGIGITGPFSNLDIRFPYVKTDTTQRYALQLGSNEATNYSALSISSVGGASQAV
ncbi:hypothetical protein KJ570_02110, partial [Patescibacteria group bacterium]|nr:hypothetical protein [Patescibacteria group bacterium]